VMGEASTGNQGRVIQHARENAREFLRKRQDFIWNATNLSREIRGQLVDLFTDYHARVRIAYVEASLHDLDNQNRNREAFVPRDAISEMMRRWEVPTPIEADLVECWISGKQIGL